MRRINVSDVTLKKLAGFWDKAATIRDNKNGNILKSKKRLTSTVKTLIIATYKKLTKNCFFACWSKLLPPFFIKFMQHYFCNTHTFEQLLL